MPLNPNIRYYINGEEVDENILNRPINDVVANLNSIYEITDGIPPYRIEDVGKYVRINDTGTGFVYTDLEFVAIRQPVAVFPLDGTSGVVAAPELEATPYAPIFSVDARDYRKFELDFDGEDFSTPIREINVNADSWVIDPDLSSYAGTSFVWRCKDVSIKGDESEWTEPQTFSVSPAYVRTPSVSVQQDGTKSLRAPLITGSAFTVFGDTDVHTHSDWEVVRVSDGVVVWSSYTDTTNLESIQVPDQILSIDTEYRFRVKYTSSTYGDSAYGSVTRTTVNYYVKIPELSTNDTGVEFSEHTVIIENYDLSLTYVISVSGGSQSRSGDIITWTLPEVTQDTTHQLTLYAVNEASEQSANVTANVNVLDIPIVSDDAYIITNFSPSNHNNIWSV